MLVRNSRTLNECGKHGWCYFFNQITVFSSALSYLLTAHYMKKRSFPNSDKEVTSVSVNIHPHEWLLTSPSSWKCILGASYRRRNNAMCSHLGIRTKLFILVNFMVMGGVMLIMLNLGKAEVLSFTELNPKTWKALTEFEITLCKTNVSSYSLVKHH